MDHQPNSRRIYRELKKKSVAIKHACEIGVYLPETSNIIDFIKDDKVPSITLVEPNPRIVEKIRESFKQVKKITLHPFAIHEYDGELNLFEAEGSTFAESVAQSPALVNDQYQITEAKKIAVECKLFSGLDPGNIDLLSIDTEGCEWYALKTMVSRPKVIFLETHGKFYTNPFLAEITTWMRQHHYHAWYKTKSDTVYYREGAFELSLAERMNLVRMSIYIKLRKAKKVFYFGRYFKK